MNVSAIYADMCVLVLNDAHRLDLGSAPTLNSARRRGEASPKRSTYPWLMTMNECTKVKFGKHT